jgi:CubicO group peptidase (beta-lactamase class C family)
VAGPAVAEHSLDPPVRDTPTTSLPGLEALVDGAMAPVRHGDVAGAVVAVVKDGEVLLLKGYGYSDLAKHLPVDPAQTLFRVGSITKTFTWAALAQLIAAGKVGLDQPIDQLLPEPLWPDSGHFADQPIVVRQLFTHTAGFEDRVLDHFFLRDPDQVLPLREELSHYKPNRMRSPGLSATYSNYGAALAGAIVEHVSGELYADYLARHIFTPLHMSSTTAREPLGNRNPESMPDALAARLSQGYVEVNGKLHVRPFEYLSQVAPAGSISSTGADMGTYMLARLSPGAILSADMESRMQSKLFTNDPALSGIGYGWILGRVGNLGTVWHDGGTMAFHSNLVLVPGKNMGIFVSTNSSTGAELVNELPKTILTTYFAAARVKPATISVDPSSLKPFTGTYLGDRLSSSTAERFFLALMAETVTVTAGPDGLEINGLHADSIGRDVFSVNGDILAFQRNDGGRVSELRTNLESFHRLPPWRTPMSLLLLCGMTSLMSLMNMAAGWRARRLGGRRRIASTLNLGASLSWLIFVGCLAGSMAQLSRSPLDVVFIYPPPILSVALVIGLCAATLSIAATVSALASMASLRWPRRFRYALSAILWAFLMLSLYDWRLLGISP